MKLLVLATLLVGASAHLCLLFPHQRGTEMDLNTAGANDCLLVDGPCGKRSAAEPAVMMMAGSNASIIFQKNLDHFDSKSPGMFTISIGDSEANMKLLKTIPDTMAPATKQSLYTETVAIPDKEMPKAVLQVTYVTKNPEAPAVFYQCADVKVMKK